MASDMAYRIRSDVEDKAENSVVNVLDRLLEKICTFVTDQFSLMLSLEELDFLKSIHPELMEVVVNAEVKPKSRDFLMAVKEFYYDGKDIVEEFDTEVSRRQLNGAHLSDLGTEDQQSKIKRMVLWLKLRAIDVVGEQKFEDISLFLKPLCGCFFPDDFSFFFFRRKIAIKIRDLYDALQKIKSFTDRMANFRNDVMGQLQNMHVAKGSIEGREVVDDILAKGFLLVGRNDFKKEIKDLLFNKSDVTASSSSGYSTSTPCVLLIWGLGGIGKTTLVQAIYNDPDVKKHFEELSQWVCVGDDELDPNKVMKEIIEKGTKESRGDTNRKKVLSIVEGKRFLIVLDDVWKGEHLRSRWEKLWDPLSHGAEGSWIIISTREQDVMNQISPAPAVDKKLNPLGDEECFQIFQR